MTRDSAKLSENLAVNKNGDRDMNPPSAPPSSLPCIHVENETSDCKLKHVAKEKVILNLYYKYITALYRM